MIENRSVSIIATGNELLRGEFINTTSYDISKILTANKIEVNSHTTISDKKSDICREIKQHLIKSDAIILTGGLGPTSDDNTKEAIADVLTEKMILNEDIWQYIKNRLQKFNLIVSESNKKQAFFPQNCNIIHNPNGTACGGHIRYQNVDIFFLPGPPKECLPMFDEYVLPYLKQHDYCLDYKTAKWQMIGVIESNFAEKIEQIFADIDADISYVCSYPYLILSIKYSDDISSYIKKIEKIFEDNIVGSINDVNLMASEVILNKKLKINIINNTPVKDLFSRFASTEDADYKIAVSGLAEIATKSDFKGKTKIAVNINGNTKLVEIPYKGPEVKQYAVEYMCFALLKSLI